MTDPRPDGCPNACADPTAGLERTLVVEPMRWTQKPDDPGRWIGAYACPSCAEVWVTQWRVEYEDVPDEGPVDSSNVVPLRSTAPVP